MTNIFQTILNPNSIAVIGASRDPDKVGHQIVRNLLDANYHGQLYPVNPQAQKILHLDCYPSIADIPETVDLAIIVTPSATVPNLIQLNNQAHVPATIIITAGFSESGEQGKVLQQQLLSTINYQPSTINHPSHTRVLGPNCLGALSSHYHLNATFGPPLPEPGNIFLISQSGAIVTGILDWAKSHHLGLSHAVTLGNRVDIGENEALEFAATDKHTDIIMVYLESFQHAPTFFSQASRIIKDKPIILLKGGQSQQGQSASASHTAALATDYKLIEAFAKQTGVILVNDLEEWLNLGALITKSPKKLGGNDLAIITNAGGPGVLTTDLASQSGLDILPLTQKTQASLKQSLQTQPHNPLDILGDAQPEDFATAIDIVAKDSIQDAVLVIMTPQTTTQPTMAAQLIAQHAAKIKKPVYAILIGGTAMQHAKNILAQHNIPTFDFPGNAIDLIYRKANYDLTKTTVPVFPGKLPSINTSRTSPTLHTSRTSGTSGTLDTLDTSHTSPSYNLKPETLNLKTAFSLLKSAGFHLPHYRIVTQQNELHAALDHVGRPAVVKTANMQLAHKAVKGGVILSLQTIDQAEQALKHLQQLGEEVVFQQTIHSNIELILGAKRDVQLGSFITVGLGGSYTNQLEDRVYAFIPTTNTYLEALFNQTKAAKILTKHAIDSSVIVESIQQLSWLMLHHPEIQEMEINPLIVTPERKAFAADIKITLVSAS